MKKVFLFYTISLILHFPFYSQTSFIKTQSIAPPLPGGNAPYNITSGLIDNDEFPDLVISTTLGDSVYWLKNDGTGNFTIQLPAIATLDSAGGVAIADINNDGFNDVVSTSYNDGKLVWFANDGLGNFGTEQIISSTISGPSQVYVRKIDADTTWDVAVSGYDGNEVIWFANDGSGVFGTKNVIVDTILNPGAFAMDDIDGDGDIDCVIGNSVDFGTPNDCRVEVFYNNGNGEFIVDTNMVSLNTKDYIFSVMAEDIDNDGSLDILVTDLLGSPSWFKRTEIVPGTATYTETVLATSIVNPACLDLQDLDNDSHGDFVLSSATSGAGNDIVWYKNNGDGTFGAETVIDATQSQAYTFTFSDFENDGDIDIASIAYNDDKVNVFSNQLIVLSTDETSLNGISIYPNPVKDYLYFKGFADVFSVSVYDVWGKILLNDSLGFDESLDVSNLPSGIYFISFKNKRETFKFIKH